MTEGYASDYRLSPSGKTQVGAKLKMQRQWLVLQANVDGAANPVTLNFGAPPRSTSWMVERVLAIGGGNLTFYLGSIDPGNAVEYGDVTTPNAADEASPIFVPEGTQLLARFVGAPALALVTCRILVRVEPGD